MALLIIGPGIVQKPGTLIKPFPDIIGKAIDPDHSSPEYLDPLGPVLNHLFIEKYNHDNLTGLCM
jgi:hypothetical protein